ncbi:hypothetical protein C3744_21785 [Priestia megaterium]|uniref:Uncharacterized protein n=1 Tax=Priestia megaterium TaxID=1404 RepID=A0A3D8WXK9_PRIMG|nr:hypothetical protein C3744_21785 [Priestia megaterium]
MLLAADWKARRRLVRKSTSITSDPYELIYPFCSPADFIDLIMSQSLFLLVPIAVIMLTVGIYRIKLKNRKTSPMR